MSILVKFVKREATYISLMLALWQLIQSSYKQDGYHFIYHQTSFFARCIGNYVCNCLNFPLPPLIKKYVVNKLKDVESAPCQGAVNIPKPRNNNRAIV